MNRPLRLAFVWAQLAIEHFDKLAAVAERLGAQAEIITIAMAGSTQTYAGQDLARPVHGFAAVTLFPGQVYEQVPAWRRCLALFRGPCSTALVFMAFGYKFAGAFVVSGVLRLLGRRVVMLNDTKFEDRPRSAWGELGKRLALCCYTAALVGGARSFEYFRFLGFRRRPILPGCDTIALDRVRRNGTAAGPPIDFAARPFVFVGRFVAVKNLSLLVQGYARYAQTAGPEPRRLVLAGSGPLEAALREQIAQCGIAHLVDLPGYLPESEVAAQIAQAAALVLPSCSETWGLVVNEAMALGVPQVVREASGARDTLVRNLITGLVFESGSSEALARALTLIVHDEGQWRAMAEASLARAWLGDAAVFADSVELLIDPAAQPAGERIARYHEEFIGYWGRSPF